MQNRWTVIGILRHVAATARITLPDTAGAMNKNFVEAAPVRLIRGLIAKVPFAKDAGSVAGLLQLLGQGGRPKGQPFALKDGVRDAVLELMPAREQRATRRGASRRDLEVNKPHTLCAKAIEVRRLEDRVTMGGNIPIALVIGQNEQDIRLRRTTK